MQLIVPSALERYVCWGFLKIAAEVPEEGIEERTLKLGNSLCYINTANFLHVCRLEETWIHTVDFKSKAASKTPHRRCNQGKSW